mmetsp:Transcript_33503/g.65983  ORF Transcript_33503/g.65983 Transcript_33503/m.65983 type:complete len:218 (+) Transcript_33503:988-1641(+)
MQQIRAATGPHGHCSSSCCRGAPTPSLECEAKACTWRCAGKWRPRFSLAASTFPGSCRSQQLLRIPSLSRKRTGIVQPKSCHWLDLRHSLARLRDQGQSRSFGLGNMPRPSTMLWPLSRGQTVCGRKFCQARACLAPCSQATSGSPDHAPWPVSKLRGPLSAIHPCADSALSEVVSEHSPELQSLRLQPAQGGPHRAHYRSYLKRPVPDTPQGSRKR